MSSQLKYYYKNREVCILRNRQYYAEQMNAGNEEILLEDECEVCAQGRS